MVTTVLRLRGVFRLLRHGGFDNCNVDSVSQQPFLFGMFARLYIRFVALGHCQFMRAVPAERHLLGVAF